MTTFQIETYIVFASLVAANSVVAQETLMRIDWARQLELGQLESGVIEPVSTGESMLRVRADGTSEARLLLRLQNLAITQSRFALVGEIRYEGVEPAGYLEMWSVFGPSEKYFSRTQATSGPMAWLEGSHPGRRFTLPFMIGEQETRRPQTLELKLVLPGQGAVWVGPVSLLEYGPAAAQAGGAAGARAGAWWGNAAGGWIGGVAGLVLGLTGVIIGQLVTRGVGAQWVKLLLGLAGGLGGLTLLAGLFGLFRGQPYAVYYPLLLGGGLAVIMAGSIWPKVRRRYAEAELRKMQAIDA